jgi:hypothetical protein
VKWDWTGTTVVAARAAFREYVKQYPGRRMTLQIASDVIDEHVPMASRLSGRPPTVKSQRRW